MRFAVLKSWRLLIVLVIALSIASTPLARADDMIEFLTGAKVQGTVTKIDKQSKVVLFSAKIGERSYEREYPYAKIHAVPTRASDTC
jgi:hypothetical protein